MLSLSDAYKNHGWHDFRHRYSCKWNTTREFRSPRNVLTWFGATYFIHVFKLNTLGIRVLL